MGERTLPTWKCGIYTLNSQRVWMRECKQTNEYINKQTFRKSNTISWWQNHSRPDFQFRCFSQTIDCSSMKKMTIPVEFVDFPYSCRDFQVWGLIFFKKLLLIFSFSIIFLCAKYQGTPMATSNVIWLEEWMNEWDNSKLAANGKQQQQIRRFEEGLFLV